MWIRTCVPAAPLSKISPFPKLINSSKTKPNKPNQNTQTRTTSCPLCSERHTFRHQREIMYFSNLYPPPPPRLADTNMHIYHTVSSVKTWRRILLHLQLDPLHVLSALKERSFLVVPRVQVGEQQFQATGWWACPSFSVTLSFAAKKSKTKTKTLLSLAVVGRSLSPTRLFLSAVGRTVSTTSGTQAYCEVVSFWLISVKILT